MKKDNFIIERFDDVAEFVSTIAKRPVNAHFWPERNDLASNKGDASFNMTKNYAESEALITTGYAKGLENLQAAGTFRVCNATNSTRNIPHASVVGYAPHVPNAIAGIPQSMIGTTRIQQKSKIVTILYNGGAAAGMAGSKFVEAGRVLMSLIIKLEMQGYRVRLDILDTFCRSDEKAFCIVTVKKHRQPINPLKISYLLLHPSFFRRQGFRWLETQPEVTYRYPGYGMALNDACPYGSSTDNIRRYLSDKGVLEKGVFYTNLYEALKNTPEQLAEKMGITIKK